MNCEKPFFLFFCEFTVANQPRKKFSSLFAGTDAKKIQQRMEGESLNINNNKRKSMKLIEKVRLDYEKE